MKKKWLAGLVLIMVLAAGCGNETTADTPVQEQTDTETVAEHDTQELSGTEEALSSEAAGTEQTAEAAYEIEMVNYQKDELRDINYPKISGWENEQKQQEWNDTFEEVAKTAAEDLGDNDSVSVIFHIQEQNEEMLSLTCETYYDYEGAAHPSAGMVSYNINMQTGEKITFADMADPQKTAENLFSEENCSVVDNEITMHDILEYNFIWMEPTEEALAASLAHFDCDFEEYGENETMGYSYMHDGRVYLIFYVNHVMGDYVVVQLNS